MRAGLGLAEGLVLRLWRWSLMVFASLLAACETSTHYNVIGVSKAGDRPRIHWHFCSDDELVTAVKLVELVGDSPWDGDDPILWEIRSAEGRNDASDFVVGHVPDGFDLVERLNSDLNHRTLSALVETTSIDEGATFAMDDLHATKVRTWLGDLVTRDAYQALAEEAC